MNCRNSLNYYNSYAEIDIKNFRHNIVTIREQSNKNVIAVLKANAYGHGDAELAKYAYELEGVTCFGVFTIDEAVNIREFLVLHNILPSEVHIMVFGYIPPEKYFLISKHNLIANIYDETVLEPLESFAKTNNTTINVSLEINTGMRRMGVSYENAVKYIDKIQNNSSNINLVHVMSHFASSDSDEELTNSQIKRFEKIVENIKNKDITTSLFNSGAVGKYRCNQDYVRVGLALYGYSNTAELNSKLKPILSLYSKVIKTTILEKGEGIGYDHTFIAPKRLKIGVLPLGYADGIDRRLSKTENYFHIGGERCRVVGTISMDTTFIDISGLDEQYIRDHKVEIFSENVRADDTAKNIGTISYEMLCNIKNRVARTYKED